MKQDLTKQRGLDLLKFHKPVTSTYRNQNLFSRMYHYSFRPSIETTVALKQPIIPEVLQLALEQSLLTHPAFRKCVALKGNDFYDYYNDVTPRIFCDKGTIERGSLCSAENDCYQFRVSYEDNTIRLLIYHMLSDGRGLLAFTATLLYYYLTALYPGIEAGSITTLETPFDQTEMEELLERMLLLPGEIPHSAFSQPEILPNKASGSKDGITWRRSVKFPAKALLEISHTTQSSPVAVVAALLGRSAMQLFAEAPQENPLAIGCPLDFRGDFKSKTMHNGFGCCPLRYYRKMQERPLDLQVTMLRGQLDLLKQPAYFCGEENNAVGLLPMWALVSSLGKFNVHPSMLPFIEGVAFSSLVSHPSYYIGMLTLGEEMEIFEDCTFEEDSLFDVLISLLKEAGIELRDSGLAAVHKPRVVLEELPGDLLCQ